MQDVMYGMHSCIVFPFDKVFFFLSTYFDSVKSWDAYASLFTLYSARLGIVGKVLAFSQGSTALPFSITEQQSREVQQK